MHRSTSTVATVAGIRVMIFFNDPSPPHVHLSKGDMDIVVPTDAPTLPRGCSRGQSAVRFWTGSSGRGPTSAWRGHGLERVSTRARST